MTCIVGLVDRGDVYIGGDSAGVANHDLLARTDAKVFRNGPMVFGFCGSFRMGDLLRYELAIPPVKTPIRNYLVVDFVKCVRKCLSRGGFQKELNNVTTGGDFLVGLHGRLFRIADDYQVGECVDPFVAIGSGGAIALGSLHSSKHFAPRKRVMLALDAAERFNAMVRRPFRVVRLKADS